MESTIEAMNRAERVIREKNDEIGRLRKLLTRAHTELPFNSVIRHDIELERPWRTE